MRKKISVTLFFIIVLVVSWGLYSTGQEHTLIVDNIYSEKKMSKKIVITVEGEKPKKINKNKKVIMDLKGLDSKFIIEIDGQKKEGIINFNLNKSAELKVEKFLANDKEWLKEINQY